MPSGKLYRLTMCSARIRDRNPPIRERKEKIFFGQKLLVLGGKNHIIENVFFGPLLTY